MSEAEVMQKISSELSSIASSLRCVVVLLLLILFCMPSGKKGAND